MSTTPIERAVATRARRWLEEDPIQPEESKESTPETAADVRMAVADAMAQHLCDHYTRRPGIAPLCQEISTRLARYGVEVDPDAGVVVSGGAEEARFVAVRALADSSSDLLLPNWADERYHVAADFAGARVTLFDPDGDLPDSHGGLLVLPTTQPGIGKTLAGDSLERITLWAVAADLTIIADEIDLPLLSAGNKQQPMAGESRLAERTLTLGGFAQTPALAAWQVAWFAGPNSLVATVRSLKQAMTICSPAPGQYAALASLKGESA
jgi:aspartate/methionine/tyrosine aminotransferase